MQRRRGHPLIHAAAHFTGGVLFYVQLRAIRSSSSSNTGWRAAL